MNCDLDSATHVLSRTPAALQALLGDAPNEWARGTEGPGTFSPFDVVGHLIDGEETDWIPRAQIIRARVAGVEFEAYDRFRHRSRNVARTLDSLLAEFAQLRTANLALVRSWSLSPADLELPGLHPALGPVTLRQLLATWVVHDLGHITQIARVMAKQYRDAVGPWNEYLLVLSDRESPSPERSPPE